MQYYLKKHLWTPNVPSRWYTQHEDGFRTVRLSKRGHSRSRSKQSATSGAKDAAWQADRFKLSQLQGTIVGVSNFTCGPHPRSCLGTSVIHSWSPGLDLDQHGLCPVEA